MRVRVHKHVERNPETGKDISGEARKHMFEIQVPSLNLCFTSAWLCATDEHIDERIAALRKEIVEYTGVDDPEPVIEERTEIDAKVGKEKSERGQKGGKGRRSGSGAGKGSSSGKLASRGRDEGGYVTGKGSRGASAGSGDAKQGSLKGVER